MKSPSLFMVISLISWCLCVINSEYPVFDWRNGAESWLQADWWCERDCQHSCEVFKLQQQRPQFQFRPHFCSLTCPSHLRQSRFAETWSTCFPNLSGSLAAVRLPSKPPFQGWSLTPPGATWMPPGREKDRKARGVAYSLSQAHLQGDNLMDVVDSAFSIHNLYEILSGKVQMHNECLS